jgi:uncharacterized protein DUF6812
MATTMVMTERRPLAVNYAARARWATVKIETDTAIYVGRLYVPETKKRVSDVLSDERQFLSLTDVSVNHTSEVESFVAINKSYVRTLRVLHEGDGEPAAALRFS